MCWRIGAAEACNTDTTQTQPHQISNTQRTENKTTDVVIQQHGRKILMMDILMSETCWTHKKWNKIASDIKLVFYSSTLRVIMFSVFNNNEIWLQGFNVLRYSFLIAELFSPTFQEETNSVLSQKCRKTALLYGVTPFVSQMIWNITAAASYSSQCKYYCTKQI